MTLSAVTRRHVPCAGCPHRTWNRCFLPPLEYLYLLIPGATGKIDSSDAGRIARVPTASTAISHEKKPLRICVPEGHYLRPHEPKKTDATTDTNAVRHVMPHELIEVDRFASVAAQDDTKAFCPEINRLSSAYSDAKLVQLVLTTTFSDLVKYSADARTHARYSFSSCLENG